MVVEEDHPGYTYWENYRKCPSPRMMGKESPRSEKKRKQQLEKSYVSRRSKHSMYSAIYIEHSKDFDENDPAVVKGLIEAMIGFLHPIQMKDMIHELEVQIRDEDSPKTIIQKVVDHCMENVVSSIGLL